MAKIKILIEGYTTADSGTEEKSCATITLIQSNKLNIVVDPGVLESQKMIIDALSNEGLNIGDINFVFLTHSHIDHYRNIGMFPEAKTLEFWGIWNKNKVIDWATDFNEEIKIIKTPGHSLDGLTFLVKAEQGLVAVCGDVFWKENSPENDPYAVNMDQLKEIREKVLSMADWIIPGHGPMFNPPK
ncbi:MAG: MBL fold metallo-hydrolase [Candidatus Paceibacterota bacterium]